MSPKIDNPYFSKGMDTSYRTRGYNKFYNILMKRY